MSGYFLFHRGIFRHEMFSNEPFTEREAWVWLIGEAAWKPTKTRAGRAVFDLERGQIAHAHRYLAQAWQWHPSKVYRFLTRLAQAGMIETSAKHEATIVTICNYDRYQTPRNAGETQTEETAKRPRNREEETNTRKENYSAEGATVREQARAVSSEVLLHFGFGDDPKSMPPEWFGAENVIDGWITKGWRPEIILASIKAQAARKTSPPLNINYYRNGIADAHATADAPLPIGKPTQGPRSETGQNLVAVAKRLSGSVVSFGPRPGSQQIRDGADGGSVRLLPSSRGE